MQNKELLYVNIGGTSRSGSTLLVKFYQMTLKPSMLEKFKQYFHQQEHITLIPFKILINLGMEDCFGKKSASHQ